MSTHRDENDGRHDFDFIFGDWTIRNYKLRDVADPDCTEWAEFDTTSHAEPIFGGLAHFDLIICGPDSPGGPWEGFTLRQFDPKREAVADLVGLHQEPGTARPAAHRPVPRPHRRISRRRQPRRPADQGPLPLDQSGAGPGPLDPGVLLRRRPQFGGRTGPWTSRGHSWSTWSAAEGERASVGGGCGAGGSGEVPAQVGSGAEAARVRDVLDG